MNRIEILAEYLAKIHSHSLSPYYENEEGDFWKEIDETSADSDEVSRAFFRNMAKKIIEDLRLL